MSISIDKLKCKGCTKCTAVCPGSLIELDENKKAYIRYPKDCWGVLPASRNAHSARSLSTSVRTSEAWEAR